MRNKISKLVGMALSVTSFAFMNFLPSSSLEATNLKRSQNVFSIETMKSEAFQEKIRNYTDNLIAFSTISRRDGRKGIFLRFDIDHDGDDDFGLIHFINSPNTEYWTEQNKGKRFALQPPSIVAFDINGNNFYEDEEYAEIYEVKEPFGNTTALISHSEEGFSLVYNVNGADESNLKLRYKITSSDSKGSLIELISICYHAGEDDECVDENTYKPESQKGLINYPGEKIAI